MAARMVLLTLAVVLLLAAGGERPVPVSGLELGPLDPAAEQHGGEGAMPGDYLWSPFFDLFLLHEAPGQVLLI